MGVFLSVFVEAFHGFFFFFLIPYLNVGYDWKKGGREVDRKSINDLHKRNFTSIFSEFLSPPVCVRMDCTLRHITSFPSNFLNQKIIFPYFFFGSPRERIQI